MQQVYAVPVIIECAVLSVAALPFNRLMLFLLKKKVLFGFGWWCNCEPKAKQSRA
jgi:hypothetical protein